MMEINKVITFYGRSLGSEKNANGDPVVLATMDASIPNEGTVTINKYTTSKEAYAEHADEIESDWDAFEKEVRKYARTEFIETATSNESTEK